MATAAERATVGRKKKDNPRDDAAIKVDRKVYVDLKLIALYERREIAEIATELLARPAARRREAAEAKARAEEAKRPKGGKG